MKFRCVEMLGSLAWTNKDVDGVGIYACAFVAAGVEDGGADIAGQRVCLWGWWFGGIVLGWDWWCV